MAHEISSIDKQQGIAQAWHGLTQVMPEIKLRESFLATWDVQPVELFDADGKSAELHRLRCSETGEWIGPAFNVKTYSPINNAKFIDTIEAALSGTRHKIASIGSVMRRGRIFCSVQLEQFAGFKAAGREFESHLNFMSSHDQSCVLTVNTSNICIVCNNTFQLNLSRRSGAVFCRVKHTKNAESRIENMLEILDAKIGVQAEFKAALDSFAAQPVKLDNARAILTGFIAPAGAKVKDDLSTRTSNTIDRVVSLFQTGAGNRGETKADLFSAVTDYYTHESASEDDKEKQFLSSEFGAGNRRKGEFFEVLNSETELNDCEKRGFALLS